MAKIHPGLACNLDLHLLQSSLPLLEAGKVHALEWSFDALFKVREIPPWFTELIQEFANANRLVGHGVYFSIFSGKWLPEQQEWLDQLKALAKQYKFAHISEHFGSLTGTDFHKGAPLSVPYAASTLAIGQDRLKRIAEACQCPVGLENLAFAYSLEEVKRQGQFLDELLEPVNGFIILDLHNLYCQLHNFELELESLIALYPLERAREIHISGGSWQVSGVQAGKQVRRDTHDHAVPEEVFGLLEKMLPRLPNLQFVMLEQMGTALHTPEQQAAFQADYLRMEEMVTRFANAATLQPSGFQPPAISIGAAPKEDPELYGRQMELSHLLENAPDYPGLVDQLQNSSLAHSDWHIENWTPYMLETAMLIARKWKDGF